MKGQCRALFNWHRWGISPLHICFLLATFSGHLLASNTHARAFDRLEMRNAGSADPNVESALDILQTETENTRKRLASGLISDFDQSVSARLRAIHQSIEENYSNEYKNAMRAKRILDLSEHVMILSHRTIPESVEQRTIARSQYGAVLNRFEKSVQDKAGHLSELSKSIVAGALRPVLTNVQQDIFFPGYGQVLNDQEYAELNGIVDTILESVAALPAVSDNKGRDTAGLREAAKVANEGSRTLLEFLRQRETSLLANTSVASAINKWHAGIESIEKAIDHSLQSAERVEIETLVAHARQQSESDIQENAPQGIDALSKQRTRSIQIAILSIFSLGFVALLVFVISKRERL